MTWLLSKIGFSSLQFYLTAGLIALVATGSAWGAWEIRAGIAARAELATAKASQEAQAKAFADATAKQHAIDTSGYSAGFAFAQVSQAIQTRTETVIQGVPTYVSPASDRACTIPVGFVRMFDGLAVRASDPHALGLYPGQPDDAASDVPLSEVTALLVTVADHFHRNAEQLSALEAEIQKQKIIIEGQGSGGQ